MKCKFELDDYYDISKTYALAREKIGHEDELVHQRLTWLITLNGFIFTAFSFSLVAEGGTIDAFASFSFSESCARIAEPLKYPPETLNMSVKRACEFTENLYSVRSALIISGMGSSFAAFIGILAAFRRISNERKSFYVYLEFIDLWMRDNVKARILNIKKREAQVSIPRLTGHTFTNWLGMTCGLMVPLIIGGAWDTVGWDEFHISVKAACLVVAVLFLILGFCSALDHKLAKTRDLPELYGEVDWTSSPPWKRILFPAWCMRTRR